MTNDEAISVGVRLDAALRSLKDAFGHARGEDEGSQNIRENIEEALGACNTARAMIRNFTGV